MKQYRSKCCGAEVIFKTKKEGWSSYPIYSHSICTKCKKRCELKKMEEE